VSGRPANGDAEPDAEGDAIDPRGVIRDPTITLPAVQATTALSAQLPLIRARGWQVSAIPGSLHARIYFMSAVHRLPGMSVEQELWDKLTALTTDTGVNRTELIRIAITALVERTSSAQLIAQRVEQINEHLEVQRRLVEEKRRLVEEKRRRRLEQRLARARREQIELQQALDALKQYEPCSMIRTEGVITAN
jgi:hypothetical protein